MPVSRCSFCRIVTTSIRPWPFIYLLISFIYLRYQTLVKLVFLLPSLLFFLLFIYLFIYSLLFLLPLITPFSPFLSFSSLLTSFPSTLVIYFIVSSPRVGGKSFIFFLFLLFQVHSTPVYFHSLGEINVSAEYNFLLLSLFLSCSLSLSRGELLIVAKRHEI